MRGFVRARSVAGGPVLPLIALDSAGCMAKIAPEGDRDRVPGPIALMSIGDQVVERLRKMQFEGKPPTGLSALINDLLVGYRNCIRPPTQGSNCRLFV